MTSSQAKRIVAVDDQQAMLDLIQRILSPAYELTTTFHPEQATALIRRVKPDLILLDVEMPLVSGWTILREIRADEQTAHIPVIMITALSGTVDKVFGLHIAHVADYITKPFTSEDLLRRVSDVLQKP
jgi:DNA-binding response OmpR family regulator